MTPRRILSMLVFNWRPKSVANRRRGKTSHRLDLRYNYVSTRTRVCVCVCRTYTLTFTLKLTHTHICYVHIIYYEFFSYIRTHKLIKTDISKWDIRFSSVQQKFFNWFYLRVRCTQNSEYKIQITTSFARVLLCWWVTSEFTNYERSVVGRSYLSISFTYYVRLRRLRIRLICFPMKRDDELLSILCLWWTSDERVGLTDESVRLAAIGF